MAMLEGQMAEEEQLIDKRDSAWIQASGLHFLAVQENGDEMAVG